MSACSCAKVLWIIIFFIICLVCILKLYRYSRNDEPENATSLDVELWLEQNAFSKYKNLFKNKGISQLSQCGQVDNLPELPAPDEQRLQKAAVLLQQRLVLRQWLVKYSIQHYYPSIKIISISFADQVVRTVLVKNHCTVESR